VAKCLQRLEVISTVDISWAIGWMNMACRCSAGPAAA
jgi:hypothetical protein